MAVASNTVVQKKLAQVRDACATGLGCETVIVDPDGSAERFGGYPGLEIGCPVYWRRLSADGIERRVFEGSLGFLTTLETRPPGDCHLIVQPAVAAIVGGAILIDPSRAFLVELVPGLPATLLQHGRVRWRILGNDTVRRVERFAAREGLFFDGGAIRSRAADSLELEAGEACLGMVTEVVDVLSPGLYEFCWDGLSDHLVILEKKGVVEQAIRKRQFRVSLAYPGLDLLAGAAAGDCHFAAREGAYLSHLCTYSWDSDYEVEIGGLLIRPSLLF